MIPRVKTNHRSGFKSVRLLSPTWGGRFGAKGVGGLAGKARAVKVSLTGPGRPSLKDDSQGSSVTDVKTNGERSAEKTGARCDFLGPGVPVATMMMWYHGDDGGGELCLVSFDLAQFPAFVFHNTDIIEEPKPMTSENVP